MKSARDEQRRLQSLVTQLRHDLAESQSRVTSLTAEVAELRASRLEPERKLAAARAQLADQEWMRDRLSEYVAFTYRYAVRGVVELQKLNDDTTKRL